MNTTFSRRRFIKIVAGLAGAGIVPASVLAAPEPATVTWRGTVLGGAASLTLHHPDRAKAELLVRQVIVEVARLERIFSLYRADSALSELNRLGVLAAPPRELVALLETSREIWASTDGMFDPTIQPLWLLLARHFADMAADPAGPLRGQLDETLDLVGLDKVRWNRDRIAFARRGMALTFNGIAQGYITDRIVDLLRQAGVEGALVDMGEIHALGRRPDDLPWRIGIEGAATPGGRLALEVTDRAIATSRSDGFRFDRDGRFNHILDPRSGLGARLYDSVVVLASDAALADAFSTAFSLCDPQAVRRITAAQAGMQVRLLGYSDAQPLIEVDNL